MASSGERTQQLIEDDPGMAEALRTVRRAADGGEVGWGDVSDDLTAAQWGRLIQTGVLEDGETGFRVADPEAVAGALDGIDGSTPADEGSDLEDDGTDAGDDPAAEDGGTAESDDGVLGGLFDVPDPDDEDAPSLDDIDLGGDGESSWTRYDKLAGLTGLVFMTGYYFDPVRNVVGPTVELVMGPIDAVLPFYAVVLIAALVTGMYTAVLQSKLMDTEKIAEIQEKMQAIQERRKEAKERGDEEALDEIQEEQMAAMGDQLAMFKEQFRPMAWSFLVVIPIFLWLYWKLGSGGMDGVGIVLPIVGATVWGSGAIGPMPAWILWYFVCSMGFGQLVRKSLNLQTTPT